MSTIGQHISNIRGLIKEYGRTTESYTDQFLYELLKGARSKVIEKVSKSFNHVSEWNWNTYVIQVQKATPAELECVPSYLLDEDCHVLKSVCKIPRALKGRNKSLFNASTISGLPIEIYNEQEWDIYKRDKIKSKLLSASIINGHLYIWNNSKLKFVKVHGVFEDPTEWADCPMCNPSNNTISTDSCFNIKTDEFSLDEDYKIDAYKIVLELLQIPLSLPQDESNDSKHL